MKTSNSSSRESFTREPELCSIGDGWCITRGKVHRYPPPSSSSFPGIDVLPRQRDGNFLDHATQRAEINNTAREEIRPKLEYKPDYTTCHVYLSSKPIQARATDSSLSTVDRFRSSDDGLL